MPLTRTRDAPLEYLEVLDRDVVSLSTLEESRDLLRYLLRMAEQEGRVTLVGRSQGGPCVEVRCTHQPQQDWPSAIMVEAQRMRLTDHVEPHREARAVMVTMPEIGSNEEGGE